MRTCWGCGQPLEEGIGCDVCEESANVSKTATLADVRSASGPSWYLMRQKYGDIRSIPPFLNMIRYDIEKLDRYDKNLGRVTIESFESRERLKEILMEYFPSFFNAMQRGDTQKNCLKCSYFDPQHFECHKHDDKVTVTELGVEDCLRDKACSTGDKDRAVDYWTQRATNAEAFIRDLKGFIRKEALRNCLPEEKL